MLRREHLTRLDIPMATSKGRVHHALKMVGHMALRPPDARHYVQSLDQSVVTRSAALPNIIQGHSPLRNLAASSSIAVLSSAGRQ